MVLTLAAELHNVVRACKLAGMSRSQFYAMKKAYEAYGKEGLLPRVRRKPAMPNRTPQYIEQEILLVTRTKPMLSYNRIADEIKTEGLNVTPSMVRYVWRRQGLSTRSARVKWVRTTLITPTTKRCAPFHTPP
jgi:transposase